MTWLVLERERPRETGLAGVDDFETTDCADTERGELGGSVVTVLAVPRRCGVGGLGHVFFSFLTAFALEEDPALLAEGVGMGIKAG